MADITVKGTAFSSDAVTGDVFYRTDSDISQWNKYDGTRWLSEQYMIPFEDDLFSTDGAHANVFWVGDDYGIHFDRVALRTYVSTTNDSDNYWTITVNSRSLDNTASAVYSAVTDSDAADTFIDNGGVCTTTVPANYGVLSIEVAATGVPGNLQIYAAAFFRFINT